MQTDKIAPVFADIAVPWGELGCATLDADATNRTNEMIKAAVISARQGIGAA
jgi:hypothetical protein